jgi:hypothetical protein
MPAVNLEYPLNAGMGPEAENVLPGYEQSRFSHARLKLRPPDGIYKVALRDLWPAFTSAIDAAEYMYREKPFLSIIDPAWQDNCLEPIEHFLYVLIEYIETCEHIIRCCFPDDATFKRSEYAKRYRNVTEPYRDRVATIVNAIKHNQNRLRLFASYNDRLVVPGYFVEAVLQNGAIGPNPNVHNAQTSYAFSFAFDLRFHFLGILMLSRNVRRAIEKIIGPPDSPAHSSPSGTYMREIAIRLGAFSRTVFPDELQHYAFPEVSFNAEEQKVVIHYPSPVPPETFGSGLIGHWASFVVANGTADTFLPPYAPQQPFKVEFSRSALNANGENSNGA